MRCLPVTIAALLLLAACSQEAPPPPVPEVATLAGLQSRIDRVVEAELEWRYPNSHASLLSEEERDALADERYSFIQAETASLATELSHGQRALLLRALREADDECRVIVLARLSAAAGTARVIIEENIPAGAHGIAFVIGHAIDEGLKMRA